MFTEEYDIKNFINNSKCYEQLKRIFRQLAAKSSVPDCVKLKRMLREQKLYFKVFHDLTMNIPYDLARVMGYNGDYNDFVAKKWLENEPNLNDIHLGKTVIFLLIYP